MYTKLDEGFLNFFSNPTTQNRQDTPSQQSGKSSQPRQSRQSQQSQQSTLPSGEGSDVDKPTKPKKPKTTNPYYQYTVNLFDLISKEAKQDGWTVTSNKIEQQTPQEFTNSLVLKKDDRVLSILLPFKDSKFSYYIYDSYETDGDVSPTTTSFKDLSSLRKNLSDKLNPTAEKIQPDYEYFSKKFNQLSQSLEDNDWKVEKNQVRRLNTNDAFSNELYVNKNNKTVAYRVVIKKDEFINKTNKYYTVGIVNNTKTQKNFRDEKQADDYFDTLSSQIDSENQSKQPQKYRTIKELLLKNVKNKTTTYR